MQHCFANAVLLRRGREGEHGFAITLCLVTSHARQPIFFVYGTLTWDLWAEYGEREGFAGCLPTHPPAPTGQLQPTNYCPLVTNSDPFEQYMK